MPWHNDYSVNLCRTVRHPLPPAGSAKGAVICYQYAHPTVWSSADIRDKWGIVDKPFIYRWPVTFPERGLKYMMLRVEVDCSVSKTQQRSCACVGHWKCSSHPCLCPGFRDNAPRKNLVKTIRCALWVVTYNVLFKLIWLHFVWICWSCCVSSVLWIVCGWLCSQ